MTNLYAKKLEKIYNKIGQLASVGRDNRLQYFQYVDELIEKGDFAIYQESLILFFQLDTLNVSSVEDIKSKTWNEICFQTKSSFLQKLSKLYKQKQVYQQSYNIYSDNISVSEIIISNKLTSTFSNTGLTASISFSKNGSAVQLQVIDPEIKRVELQTASWEINGNGNEVVTQSDFFEEYQISYFANSFTAFNPSQLIIGDSFSMSVTTTKQYIPGQLISVTWSGSYIEGLIESYNPMTGETSIEITDTAGSLTHSLWQVNYLSGPQQVIFQTSISLVLDRDYLVTTTQKNDLDFEFHEYSYKLSINRDTLLGQIYEIETYDPLNSDFLVQNKNYARFTGERKTYLQVQKTGITYSVVFDLENPLLSDEVNQINRYTDAINYFLS